MLSPPDFPREICHTIGENIQYWREKKGFKQADIEKFIGVERSYLSNLERGKRAISADALWRISAYLGVSIEKFFPPPSMALQALITILKRKAKRKR